MNITEKIIVTDTNIITDLHIAGVLKKYSALNNVFISDLVKNDEINFKTCNIETIEDMKRVSKILRKESISTKDYSENGKYKVQTILSRFGSWNDALNIAELQPTGYKEITDIDLFEEIEKCG